MIFWLATVTNLWNEFAKHVYVLAEVKVVGQRENDTKHHLRHAQNDG